MRSNDGVPATVIGLLLLLSACAPTSGRGAPTPSDATASQRPALPPVTAAPTPTARPTPLTAVTPKPDFPTVAPASAHPPMTAAPDADLDPPIAVLRLPDGTILGGTLGSYHFGGTALDAPWLPARSLPRFTVPSGSTLELGAAPLAFVRWSARFADAHDESGELIHPLDSGGDGVTPQTEAVLVALPVGSWVLAVQLYFADDAGEANYYWHVLVPASAREPG